MPTEDIRCCEMKGEARYGDKKGEAAAGNDGV